jgi:NAD(P)-dependent dehydrogenase (short-subunit alcohol dehydrogenase family)
MNRVVLVTGAASGNGRAIASRFLALGDCVAVVDIDGAAMERVRGEAWPNSKDRLLCHVADVASADGVANMLDATVTRFDRIDVLVNNAGITGGEQATKLHATPIEAFDRVMAINVRGVFLCCRAALPIMLEQGGGVIVNIASVAGMVAFPGRAAYTASKGAVIQMTRSIAADYAAEGIRCNALCPGMIDTPMTHWRLEQPKLRAEVLARIPQREIGTVEDVAGAVAFLAGPDARYFNGAAIAMDGGYAAI